MKINAVYFEINDYCNLNCKTCYNSSGKNAKRIEISKERFKYCIDTLIPLGLRRVLIGGGEPLLHPEINEILDFVKLYPSLSFGIVTNGTVHNERLFDLFNSRDNLTVQISLDGSCEKQNAKTRGVGNFAKAETFIKCLRNKKTRPLIKMVISQFNFSDVENFYRFAVSAEGVPEYAFVNKQGNGAGNWGQMAVTPQQKLKVLKMVDRLNKEFDIKAVLPLCTSKCPIPTDLDNISPAIKTDGSMIPCQLLYDDCFTIGNIFDFDKEDFFKNYVKIGEMVKQRKETDYGCERCIIKNDCCKGCMASAHSTTGNYLACDGECDYRKLQFVGYHMKNYLVGYDEKAENT